MRLRFAAVVFGLALLGGPEPAEAQSASRLNPMITLHEQGLPVFGISHPAITAGRGGGAGRGGAAGADGQAAPAPPQPVLSEVARETLAYRLADFQYGGAATERFFEYVEALGAAGGTARTHAFIAKTLIYHRNPEVATARIHNQLNAGHVGIMTEAIESAEELRQAIAAMRFRSRGGTRPDEGTQRAAAYWGMSEAEYREKADVWPLNPDGELILWAILESREGLARVREIAAEPGLGVLWAGYGTLGQVFSGDPEGREAAAQQILAACKEFNVPCGFPVNNPADMERRMAEGWSVFVMQGRNEAGFAAIETGRRLSGRPVSGP